jgi:ABC-2 type transport system permease protein
MLTPMIASIRKDLLLFLHDRRAVVFALAAPIAIASFFGAIFADGDGGEPAAIPVLVSDQDRSSVSVAVVAALQGDASLAVELLPPEALRTAVREGAAAVGVIIPPGFGDAAGRAFFGQAAPPEIEIAHDPSRAAELGMVRGMLTGHVTQAVSREVFAGERGSRLAEETLAQLDASGLPADQQDALRQLLTGVRSLSAATAGGAAAPGLVVPFVARERAMTAQEGTPYNSYAHAFAGMTVQFILFAAIDLGIAILLERQQGLWKRLRSAPVSKTQLLGSRLASAAIIGFSSLLICFAFAIVVWDVRISGSVVGFLMVAMAFAVMAASFGLLLAALGRTPGATRGVAILATLVMVMLGGAWVPTFVFPAWLQQLTVVMPTRWAVDGLDAMTWRGVGLSGAWMPVAVLLGCAAVFTTAAVARFRWEES